MLFTINFNAYLLKVRFCLNSISIITCSNLYDTLRTKLLLKKKTFPIKIFIGCNISWPVCFSSYQGIHSTICQKLRFISWKILVILRIFHKIFHFKWDPSKIFHIWTKPFTSFFSFFLLIFFFLFLKMDFLQFLS